MEHKHTYVSLFSGIFFFFFLLGLVAYVSVLRSENEQEARRVLSQLVDDFSLDHIHTTEIEQLFDSIESLPFSPEAFLVLNQGIPLVFWGNQELTTWDSNGLSLQTLTLEQERITVQTPSGVVYLGIFRLLGAREYFLVSRGGFIVLSGYFLLLLLGFFLSQKKQPVTNKTTHTSYREQNIPEPTDQVQVQVSNPALDETPKSIDETAQGTPITSSELSKKDKQPQLGDIEFLVYNRNVLDERLSGELHRAGSNQLDLSLGLIRADDGISEIELFTALREYFIYKDVLYREEKGQCWVMFPQMGLDEAVRETQRFIQGVKKKIVLGDDSGNTRPVPTISSGLSSRNGRILGSARLIKEAKEALKKTDKQSPVVGFRSDPDQYRQFILKKHGS
jgi:GGDEF domain-containing protein